MTRRLRSGLTLIEILVAMLVFTVGALALAASSAAMIRQMSSNSQRSRSYSIARSKDEKVHASPCVPASGSDRSPGIVADWQVSARPLHVSLDQSVRRSDPRGSRTDVFRSGAPCD